MEFSPVVLENTDTEFVWRGSMLGLLGGDHSFKFEPSKTTTDGTTFINTEKVSGHLGFLLTPFADKISKSTEPMDNFNQNLKRRIEGKE
jgi:hypothetical protein